jgi:hypothetical protein
MAPEGHDFRYPDPTTLGGVAVSPASSNASHQSGAAQPYYGSQPPVRRPSPVLASPFPQESSRASSSPGAHATSGAPGPTAYPPYPGEASLKPHNNNNLPIRTEGRTPPPVSTSTAPATSAAPAQTATSREGGTGGTTRPGMSISSIVSGDGSSPGARSMTDDSMIKRLGK